MQRHLRAWYLGEIWRGLLNGHRDDIEYLPLGALDLGAGFALEGIDVLGFPVLDDDFCAFGCALAEYLLDRFSRLFDSVDQGRNHLGQFKAIVLMQRADERRLEVGGKVKVADVKSCFDLRQREALFVAKVKRAFRLAAPLDYLKRNGMVPTLLVFNGRKFALPGFGDRGSGVDALAPIVIVTSR